MSQITTHVLDTSKGHPAMGIKIELQQEHEENRWETIASGTTNADGRIPDFLMSSVQLKLGSYRMLFKTRAYFENQGIKAFYPHVVVVFELRDNTHHHIPLLLSPFGYSTYRGS